MNASSDNKILIRHRLYNPTLNSPIFQHSISNDTAPLQHVLQCYRNLSIRSGANSGTVGNLPRRIRLLRIGVGAYTATFRMLLRECMRIHAKQARWHSFAHLQINDTKRFPKLAFYRQPFCKASGLQWTACMIRQMHVVGLSIQQLISCNQTNCHLADIINLYFPPVITNIQISRMYLAMIYKLSCYQADTTCEKGKHNL